MNYLFKILLKCQFISNKTTKTETNSGATTGATTTTGATITTKESRETRGFFKGKKKVSKSSESSESSTD